MVHPVLVDWSIFSFVGSWKLYFQINRGWTVVLRWYQNYRVLPITWDHWSYFGAWLAWWFDCLSSIIRDNCILWFTQCGKCPCLFYSRWADAVYNMRQHSWRQLVVPFFRRLVASSCFFWDFFLSIAKLMKESSYMLSSQLEDKILYRTHLEQCLMASLLSRNY